jgi:hypothetical protein
MGHLMGYLSVSSSTAREIPALAMEVYSWQIPVIGIFLADHV